MIALTRSCRALALLLLAWQAIVAQAHLHVRAPLAAKSVAAGAHASAAPQRQDNPSECPVCREVAHAGQYLSPGPVLIAAPAAVASRRAAAALVILSRTERSHFWRSRAPPVTQIS